MEWLEWDWKVLVGRGVAALVVGLLAMFAPVSTLVALVALLGAWALVDGVTGLVTVYRAEGERARHRLATQVGLDQVRVRTGECLVHTVDDGVGARVVRQLAPHHALAPGTLDRPHHGLWPCRPPRARSTVDPPRQVSRGGIVRTKCSDPGA